MISCIFTKKLVKNCCFYVKFGGIFPKRLVKIRKIDEKSTILGRKVAVRGSDEKIYFFLQNLHKILSVSGKTCFETIFRWRAISDFHVFSEVETHTSQLAVKTGEAGVGSKF